MANLQSQIDILAKAIIRNFADDRRMVESFGGGIEDYNPFDVIYQNEYGNELYDLSYLNENHESITYSDNIKEYVYQGVINEIKDKIVRMEDLGNYIGYIEVTPSEITGENDSITIKDFGKISSTTTDQTTYNYYYGKITFNGETKSVKFTNILLENGTDYFINEIRPIVTITNLIKSNGGGWTGNIDGNDVTIDSIFCVDDNKEWSNIIKVKFKVTLDTNNKTFTIDTKGYDDNNVYIPISEEMDPTNDLFKISFIDVTPTITEIDTDIQLKLSATINYKTTSSSIPIPIHDQKYQTRLTNVGEKLKDVTFSSLHQKLHKYGPINTYDISCINVEGWNFMNKISVNEETVHNITDGENYTLFNQTDSGTTTEGETNISYDLTFEDNNTTAYFDYGDKTIYLSEIKTEDGNDWKTPSDETYFIKSGEYGEYIDYSLNNISLSKDGYEAFIETKPWSDTKLVIKNVIIGFLNNPFLEDSVMESETEKELTFKYNSSDGSYTYTKNGTEYKITSIELLNTFPELSYNITKEDEDTYITIKGDKNNNYSLILDDDNDAKITSKITTKLLDSNKDPLNSLNLKITLQNIRHNFKTRENGDTHYLNNIISCNIVESNTSTAVYIHLAKNPLEEYTSETEFYINDIEILSDNELTGNIEGKPVIIKYLGTNSLNSLNRIIAAGYIKCSNTTDKVHTQIYNTSGSNDGSPAVTITIDKIYIAEENRYPEFNDEYIYEIKTLTYDSVNKYWECKGTYDDDGDSTTDPKDFTCYITSIVKQQLNADSRIKELTTTHKHKNYYFAKKEMVKFPCNHIIDKNGYIHTYYYPDEENNAFNERKNKYSHFNGLQERLFKNIKPSHQYNLDTGIFRSDIGPSGTEQQCFNYYIIKNLLQNVTRYIEKNYADGTSEISDTIESRLLNLFTPIGGENIYPSKGKFSEKSTSSLCMYITNGTISTNDENTGNLA